MAIGRISGPLLKANLLREGVNLAFENDLLYLDVNNSRIGINTATPQYDLDVAGTTRSTDLQVSTEAQIADVNILGNTISTTSGTLTLGTADNVVYQNRLTIDSLDLQSNIISSNVTNADIEFAPNGTGSVEIFADTNVYGNVHATGSITADGNIQIGDADTDNVTFNAEIASDIIPDADDTYSLGSDPATGGKQWADVWTQNFYAGTVTTTGIIADGIDLALRQGNILYVAENGSDSYSGDHPNDPYGTLSYALSQATAGDTVHIYPGTYQETFPLTVPAGVTIKGHSLRGVKIVPTALTDTNTAFLLNGEVTIEDLTIADFFAPGNAFELANNFTVTTRSPYIRNVTVLTQGSVTSAGDPRGFNQGDAGGGAFLDGKLANSASNEASVLFHSVTFICPGVECIKLTNGVRIEWLNSFTYFADKSIHAYDSVDGLKNAGKTRIKLGGIVGTFTQGNTITFTSTDGSSVQSTLIDSVDGDTVIIDGAWTNLIGFDFTPQSISDGSATATEILNYDLGDFGAEVRLIGSASIYGNYGLYGDGPGVVMYAIGHNMAYIGNGKETSNDPNTVIQANEVVELNDAKVRYNTVDHQGDFRVGDLFHVDQQTGTVTFSSTDVNITTTQGVTISTGGSDTVITGTQIDTGNLTFAGNTISSTTGDIILDSHSGTVKIDSTSALQLPKGDTASRPAPVLGMIRYNTQTNLFEGYDGNWIALNGIYDLDLDTYITAELTPGANDDTIRFYIAGGVVTTIDADKLETPRIEVDDIEIDGNTISTITANTDLNLSSNGSGAVVIDDIAIKDSTITNRAADTVLQFDQSGSGYFKIDSTSGFVVPVGTSNQRPAAAYRETGMTRFNTEQGYLEVWDGNSWVSVAGASGAITFAAAEDLAIEYVLTLG